MKDFGVLNAPHSTCQVCASCNHRTHQHNALNDVAPDMGELLVELVKADDGSRLDYEQFGFEAAKIVEKARAILAKIEASD